MKQKTIRLKIYRFNPAVDSEPGYKLYEVPKVERGLQTVMNALEYIFENLDPGLAFYRSCRGGVCSGCRLSVNGRQALSCMTIAGDGMVLGPAKGYKVIKDLVVDFNHKDKGQ